MSRVFWLALGALLGAAAVILAARTVDSAPPFLVDEAEPVSAFDDATDRGFVAPH